MIAYNYLNLNKQLTNSENPIMKTNLCNSIISDFQRVSLNPTKWDRKLESILKAGQVSGLIYHCKNVIGSTEVFGFQQPRDLLEYLLGLENKEMPIYNLDAMNKECHDLIRLGFCYLEGSYLKVNKDLLLLVKHLDNTMKLRKLQEETTKTLNTFLAL